MITASVAITYIALRRYYSFLVDGSLLLNQTQELSKLSSLRLFGKKNVCHCTGKTPMLRGYTEDCTAA